MTAIVVFLDQMEKYNPNLYFRISFGHIYSDMQISIRPKETVFDFDLWDQKILAALFLLAITKTALKCLWHVEKEKTLEDSPLENVQDSWVTQTRSRYRYLILRRTVNSETQ